jgi:hypothetical protein
VIAQSSNGWSDQFFLKRLACVLENEQPLLRVQEANELTVVAVYRNSGQQHGGGEHYKATMHCQTKEKNERIWSCPLFTLIVNIFKYSSYLISSNSLSILVLYRTTHIRINQMLKLYMNNKLDRNLQINYAISIVQCETMFWNMALVLYIPKEE